jgi:Skp family chaperone for outer membrane proteins
MVLRLSLVVAILASAATLYFTHVKVADRISNLTGERDAAQSAQRTAEEQQRKAEKERRLAKEELDKANKALADKSAAFDAASAKLAEQEKRANQLNEDLTRVTGERNTAQDELAVWKQLGVTPEQVKGFNEALVKSNDERDSFQAENKILLRNNDELKVELSRYVGEEIDPKMPAGLNGQVVAVDPKYDFVVLNVGGNQGVVENGKLLVDRNGKLVAKVRVAKVLPDRSIANVMPNWRLADVMEGDKVIY